MTRSRWLLTTLSASLAIVWLAAATGCRTPADGPSGPASGAPTGSGTGATGGSGSAAAEGAADSGGSAGQAEGGMKAYVDPETGELLERPPPGAEPLPGDVMPPPTGVQPRPAPGGGEILDTAPGDREAEHRDGD